MLRVTGDSSFDSHKNALGTEKSLDNSRKFYCFYHLRAILAALARFAFISPYMPGSLHAIYHFSCFGNSEALGNYFFGLHFRFHISFY